MEEGGGALQPKTVLYCGVCGLPPEYCEFGPDFEKCKPWLIQHSPETYPDLISGSGNKDAADAVQGLSIQDGDKAAGDAKAASASTSTTEPGAKAKEGAKLPGGKAKKKEKQEVLVEKVTRSKRKSITTIKGLETFGVKLPDAAKKLGKKFACGASVTKGPTEKEQIDVQGDIIFDIADYITETWHEVPREAIFLIEDGKKAPAY